MGKCEVALIENGLIGFQQCGNQECVIVEHPVDGYFRLIGRTCSAEFAISFQASIFLKEGTYEKVELMKSDDAVVLRQMFVTARKCLRCHQIRFHHQCIP